MFLASVSSRSCVAQSYSSRIYEATTDIGDEEFTGWSTFFDFDGKTVYRGFWKYCKDFSRPYNEKRHYRVVIPATETGADIDITFYGKATIKEKSCDFFVALEKDGLPGNKIDSYSNQVKKILSDFKREFYLDQVEDKIDIQIKSLAKLSRQYERSMAQNKEMEQYVMVEKIKLAEKTLADLQRKKLTISK